MNVDHNDPWTEHFFPVPLALWWIVAFGCYHDIDHYTAGPVTFCKALELTPEQVFPLSIDLREHVIGEASILKGSIPLEARERFSRRELIRRAVSRHWSALAINAFDPIYAFLLLSSGIRAHELTRSLCASE
jgi:hypothetical protein